MKVLALDTTTRAGSVALIDNNRVIDERIGDATRSHAERLPHEIQSIASAHQIALTEIDLFAVASGPGWTRTAATCSPRSTASPMPRRSIHGASSNSTPRRLAILRRP